MEENFWPPRPDGHTPDKTGRPDEPWLTRDAITRLEDILRELSLRGPSYVLEFGSGASTIWLAKRASWIASIEHDQEWSLRVLKAISEEKILNSFPYWIPCDNDFHFYVQEGVRLATAHPPELLLVDGRRRVRCVKAIAPLMGPGSYLVLDNAERPDYAEAHKFLANDWTVEPTTNGLWRTDIFRKKG
jgi:hypothetical protein